MGRDSSKKGAEAGMRRKVTYLSPWFYRSLLNGHSGDVQEEDKWKQVAWVVIVDGDLRGVADMNPLTSLGKQVSACFVCFLLFFSLSYNKRNMF